MSFLYKSRHGDKVSGGIVMDRLLLFAVLSVGIVGWSFLSLLVYFDVLFPGSTAARAVSAGVFVVALSATLFVRRRNKRRQMREIVEMEEDLKVGRP